MVLTLLTVLYVLCAVLLAFYTTGALILLIAYLRHRSKTVTTPQIDTYPTVAVQLPIYNEKYVVERLLNAMAALDYPRDRLTIQVLDDSNDETTDIIADMIPQLRADGLNIDHVRRPKRTGYKAGALAYGLTLLDVEYVAILDADFIPAPDFLTRTVPHMVVDPKLSAVQGRWGHINTFGNILTIGQTLALDGHFVVEQTGRNRAGFLMNFNGSGGVWRVKAIEDAGGWDDCTLTEDLDLSYRAQLKGWKFLYLPDVVVPGELPPHLAAYKQQQARWAKGGTQCLTLLMRPIWQSDQLSMTQRIMATLHLCQYLSAPIIVTLLLLTPPLLFSRSLDHLPIGSLGLLGIVPPLIYIVSQYSLYANWKQRILSLPALIAIGTGMTWNNTKAVFSGLFGKTGEFKRTPKYSSTDAATNKYVLKADSSILVEIALGLYALVSALIAVKHYPTFVPYLFLYAVAFFAIASWGIREQMISRKAALIPVPVKTTSTP